MSDYRKLVLDNKDAVARLGAVTERLNRLQTLRRALVGDLNTLSSSEQVKQLLDVDVEIAQVFHEYELALITYKSTENDINDFITKEVESRECQEKTS